MASPGTVTLGKLALGVAVPASGQNATTPGEVPLATLADIAQTSVFTRGGSVLVWYGASGNLNKSISGVVPIIVSVSNNAGLMREHILNLETTGFVAPWSVMGVKTEQPSASGRLYTLRAIYSGTSPDVFRVESAYLVAMELA